MRNTFLKYIIPAGALLLKETFFPTPIQANEITVENNFNDISVPTLVDSSVAQDSIALEQTLEDTVNYSALLNKHKSVKLRALEANFNFGYMGLWDDIEGKYENIAFVTPRLKTLTGKTAWLTRLAESFGMCGDSSVDSLAITEENALNPMVTLPDSVAYKLQKEFANQTVMNTIEFYINNPKIADVLRIDPAKLKKDLMKTNVEYPNALGDPKLLGNLIRPGQPLIIKPEEYSKIIQKYVTVASIDPDYARDNAVKNQINVLHEFYKAQQDSLLADITDINERQEILESSQRDYLEALGNTNSYLLKQIDNLNSTTLDLVNAEQEDKLANSLLAFYLGGSGIYDANGGLYPSSIPGLTLGGRWQANKFLTVEAEANYGFMKKTKDHSFTEELPVPIQGGATHQKHSWDEDSSISQQKYSLGAFIPVNNRIKVGGNWTYINRKMRRDINNGKITRFDLIGDSNINEDGATYTNDTFEQSIKDIEKSYTVIEPEVKFNLGKGLTADASLILMPGEKPMYMVNFSKSFYSVGDRK
jgi:hypothetical protein